MIEQISETPLKTHIEVRNRIPGGPDLEIDESFIEVQDFSFYYGPTQVLFDVSLRLKQKHITALIGPSGCGKSTLLRTFNRMNDLIPMIRYSGSIRIRGQNILASDMDAIELRRRIGMVFQKSNPFPKSIYENVVYGLRMLGLNDRKQLDIIVERCLKQAALWEEVKDSLHKSALELSGGQQQRLCIARALSVNPEIILMDEPCSALDPMATGRIEELMFELKKSYTIIIVTHNMQQAARVSDETGFLYMGKLIEFGQTDKMFTKPDNPMTESYITGRFG